METQSFQRECPRCGNTFNAVSIRGICQMCNLFFRSDRNGQLIGIVETFEPESQIDWPYESLDQLCAATFEAFQYGGGQLFLSDRHDGYPEISIVHEQLRNKFRQIWDSIKPHLPDSADCRTEFEGFPECYVSATQIESLCWIHDGRQYQLNCVLSLDGGSIDAVIDGQVTWNLAD